MPKPTRLNRRRLKKLPEEVEAIRQAHPSSQVELWSSDEHRVGLKPILRRVWAPKGTSVTAIVAPHYQWMYVYAFVHPESGRTSWLLLPTVNVEAFSQALALFAQETEVGPDKQIVLLLDGAGWHKSAKLEVPQGIHLVFLPPYSPELQPAERLWPLSNEPLANRSFTSLDELEQVQAERCCYLQTHPELIRAQPCFHWWPSSLDST
jgi:transposase